MTTVREPAVTKREFYAADVRNYESSLRKQGLDEATIKQRVLDFIESLPPP